MKKKTSKKQLILIVLKLLETSSDEAHPLRQTHIAKTISEVYPCDRKTVSRNIKFLKEMGYPIEKTKGGFYLSGKRFSVDETKLILNAVENSQDIPEETKTNLVTRLSALLTRAYR